MNPEVFMNATHEVEMAMLREYDVVAHEIPYAIMFPEPLNLTVRDVATPAVSTWEVADAVISDWARKLPDNEFHDLVVMCFFEGGKAAVPVSVTRANGAGFSLMGAFFEMVLDRTSPAKV